VEKFRLTDVSTNTAFVIFTLNVTGNYRGVFYSSGSEWSVRGYCLIGSMGTALPTKCETFFVVIKNLLKAVNVIFAETSVNIFLSGPIPKAYSTHYILIYFK
jgi:hypothetical protein